MGFYIPTNGYKEAKKLPTNGDFKKRNRVLNL